MLYSKLAKRLLMSACVIFAVIIVYGFARYLSLPSQSQILSSGATTSSTNGVGLFNNTPVTVKNAYFSFAYPAAMFTYKVQKLSSPELANYSYGYNDIESWQLTVSDQTLPESSLMQDSAYLLRSQNTDRYALSTISINGQQVPVMADTKASGFNKIAFLLQGSDVIHVSLYGNDTAGTTVLNNVFMQVINSIKWNFG